jgi:hypothetical protein
MASQMGEQIVSDDFYHDDPIEEKTTRKFRNNLLTPFALIIASVFFFQSTLAGNISLNSNSGVEFGQGVSQTVACSGSDNLMVTPYSSFVNAAGTGGTYYLNSVKVSGIPSTCDGVDFTISAYGNSDRSPLAIFNTSSTIAVVNDVQGAGFTVPYSSTVATISGSSSEFTLTFVSPVAISGSVFKLTLQSGEHVLTCAEGGKCAIGDMGPGGGTVFYVSSGFTASGTACNTSCRYLEAAPVSGTNAWTDQPSMWSATTNVSVGVTSSLIGFGKSNTDLMYAQSSSAGYPARLSRDYRGPNNYSDWFIPSGLEAVEMHRQKNVLAVKVFTDGQARYWSSTQDSTNTAFKADTIYTENVAGAVISINKNTPPDAVGNSQPYSRAIRAF